MSSKRVIHSIQWASESSVNWNQKNVSLRKWWSDTCVCLYHYDMESTVQDVLPNTSYKDLIGKLMHAHMLHKCKSCPVLEAVNLLMN